MSLGKPQKGSKASAKALAATSREIMGETRPSREAYFQSLQDAIQTGGASGRIPVLNAALAGSNAGRSTAAADTKTLVNRAGFGGTDFGSAITRGTDINAGVTTGATREQIITQLLGQAPNAALGQAQQATQALGASASRNAQLTAAAQAAQSQAVAGGASALGSIAGAVILAALA